jgi:hypothetical protein
MDVVSEKTGSVTAYTRQELAEFRRQIKAATRWAEAKGLEVMPSCWSLGTLYGLKGCAQLGFCCPLGATVLRQPPRRLNPHQWTCLSAARPLGASEEFVTGFITGYEGHARQPGWNVHYHQGYRMGRQFRRTYATR